MQERSRASRAVAVATATILLAAGVLAAHHQTAAAHVRDDHGGMHHAQQLAEHHEDSALAHLHGRDVHGHAGECRLLALAHEPVVHVAIAIASANVASAYTVASVDHTTAFVSLARYRLAPKTSPPARA